jgi:hypothetical protein
MVFRIAAKHRTMALCWDLWTDEDRWTTEAPALASDD